MSVREILYQHALALYEWLAAAGRREDTVGITKYPTAAGSRDSAAAVEVCAENQVKVAEFGLPRVRSRANPCVDIDKRR